MVIVFLSDNKISLAVSNIAADTFSLENVFSPPPNLYAVLRSRKWVATMKTEYLGSGK